MKYWFALLALIAPLTCAADFTWDLMKQAHFRTAYLEVLGNRQNEHWLKSLSGPSDEISQQKIEDQNYLLANSCMPHSCDTNNLVLAYSPVTQRVFIKLVEEGRITWLGTPTITVKNALESYYQKHFEQKSSR